MSRLELDRRIERPDDIYDRLVMLLDGLTDRESMVVSAKLILLLFNHIGDEEVLVDAMRLARPRAAEMS